ncbi:MAG: hypothetical protein JNM19_00945 [Chitinophagaceae bacterium]|nr:hypothetical protein [Chitinophagaceae bacterium]
MLSDKEKKFIRYWNEQREGGKWSYIITYTIGGAVIAFFLPLTIFYILSMLQFFRLIQLPVWLLVVLAFITSFAASQYFWYRNEKRWRSLTRQ